MGGGDLKEFALSRSSTWRKRIKTDQKVEHELNLKFSEAMDRAPYVIAQWDAKKVMFESGHEEERLVICIQNVTANEQQFV